MSSSRHDLTRPSRQLGAVALNVASSWSAKASIPLPAPPALSQQRPGTSPVASDHHHPPPPSMASTTPMAHTKLTNRLGTLQRPTFGSSRPGTFHDWQGGSQSLSELTAESAAPANAAESFSPNTTTPSEAIFSRVLADDRERHRKELDGSYRREKVLSAKVQELLQQVADAKKRDLEVRRQWTSMMEAMDRSELRRVEQERFAALCQSALREVSVLACRRTERPPVKDSELLRALKRAERRVLQLEGTSSHDMIDNDGEGFAPRPGTTPAAPPRHAGLQHVGDARIEELEALDGPGRRFTPFLRIVHR